MIAHYVNGRFHCINGKMIISTMKKRYKTAFLLRGYQIKILSKFNSNPLAASVKR